MPRPALKCRVKLKLKQVACPGTLHLADRSFVFITVSLLAQTRRTKSVFASFPFIFNDKLTFERIFTNARTVDHLLEILEDEVVSIELRQYSDRYDDGKVLARFEQTSRQFLFPTPSFVPKDDVNREVLLSRTQNYPIERGIDPQLSFTTNTRIEETSIASSSREHLSRSRISPPKTTNSPRKIPIVRPQSSSSETEEEAIITTPRTKWQGKHCICECPGQNETRPRSISPNRSIAKGSPLRKPPFKAGRAPKDLISKRNFDDSPRRFQKLPAGFITDVPCSQCHAPSPGCPTCGVSPSAKSESFLRRKQAETSPNERSKSSLLSTTRRSPSPKTKRGAPTARARIPVNSPVDDEDRYRAALAVSRDRSRSRARMFHEPSATQRSTTGMHVHSTVKDLLRKNDSVLQYELTDSELEDSLMSDISDDDIPARESPKAFQREVPDRSVVVPLSAGKYWSSGSHAYTNKRHRELFNDSLNEIYKELYRNATASD